jgi:predicted transcriptional regulator
MHTHRHRLHVKLEPDLAARLARLADEEDRTRSAIVRRALRTYLDNRRLPRELRVHVPEPDLEEVS